MQTTSELSFNLIERLSITVSTARLEDCIALDGSRQGLSLLDDNNQELKLGTTTIAALESVRLNGVDIESCLD